MDNAINYKFELFEGPLELLLSLVDKHKMKIDDIPIDLLCDQYMSYIREAQLYNIDLACEFTYMASELMLIKSRMLLPRDVKRTKTHANRSLTQCSNTKRQNWRRRSFRICTANTAGA